MKFLRQSPYKVRLVLDSVRGKKANYALDSLKLSYKQASIFIFKALTSAMSNFSQENDEADLNSLYIKKAYVDEGPKIKRFRPAAMGRATRIIKRTSHLTVIIGYKG